MNFTFIKDQERLDTILRYLQTFHTLDGSAKAAGISRDYLMRTLRIGEELLTDYGSRNYPDDIKDRYIWFFEEVNKARGSLTNMCLENMLLLLNDPDTPTNLKLDGYKWLLTRMDKDLDNKPNKLELEVTQKGMLEDAVKRDKILEDMQDTIDLIETTAKVKEVDDKEE